MDFQMYQKTSSSPLQASGVLEGNRHVELQMYKSERVETELWNFQVRGNLKG